HLAVGEVVRAGGRVDADDPEPAEVALAHAPVAIGVLQAVLDLLLRALLDLRLQAPVAGGLGQNLAALLARVNGSLDAGHETGLLSACRAGSWRASRLPARRADTDGRSASASATSSPGCASADRGVATACRCRSA